MKIRQGFVSNSSSSSFMLRGVAIIDDMKKAEALKKECENARFADCEIVNVGDIKFVRMPDLSLGGSKVSYGKANIRVDGAYQHVFVWKAHVYLANEEDSYPPTVEKVYLLTTNGGSPFVRGGGSSATEAYDFSDY